LFKFSGFCNARHAQGREIGGHASARRDARARQ